MSSKALILTLAYPTMIPLSWTYGVTPSTLLRHFSGIIAQESAYDPNAIGAIGEIGLTQIRPESSRLPESLQVKKIIGVEPVRIGLQLIDNMLYHFNRGERVSIDRLWIRQNRGVNSKAQSAGEYEQLARGKESHIPPIESLAIIGSLFVLGVIRG